MRIFNKIYQMMAVATLTATAVSCTSASGNDLPDAPDQPEATKVEAVFTVDMPLTVDQAVATRAGASETDILTADGLVFDENNKFIEVIPAGNIAVADGKATITFYFDKISKKRTIHIIANARDKATNADRIDYTPLTEGCAESQVAQLKTVALPAGVNLSDHAAPPVMWGRVVMNGGIPENTNVSGIKLLRSVACVTAKTADANASNGLGDFELEGMTVINESTVGYVTPTTAVTTAPTATPATGRPAGAVITDPARAWVYDALPSLYVYERNCSNSDYMPVIIKGKYKGVSGYYKIILLNASGTPYNIVRNHRYILNINSVTDRGYADLATAIASKPSNALKTTLVDSDINYSSVTGDSQYLLRLDCNTSEVLGHYSTDNTILGLRLATIYSDRELTPTLVYDNTQTWISNVKVSNLGGKKYAVVANLINDGADHTLEFLVKSDNLELPFTLKWRPNDVVQSTAATYTVNLLNAGETNWNVKILSGQTATPWFGLTNTAVPITVSAANYSSYFLPDINSRFNPGAYAHVSKGTNNQAIFRKSCMSPSGAPVASRITLLRHQ